MRTRPKAARLTQFTEEDLKDASTAISGSVAWVDRARAALLMTKIDTLDANGNKTQVLAAPKANYARRGLICPLYNVKTGGSAAAFSTKDPDDEDQQQAAEPAENPYDSEYGQDPCRR